ncbi:MAG: discoidin domain-containing protein [Polyangiaceae bacterium]|nr:discoidin domain-containing protein [Polyangiaceae bacterium]
MTQTSHAPTPSGETTSIPAPSTGSFSRFWEWLWQSRAIREARNNATRVAPRERLLLDQAHALLDLAERVRDRVASVSADSVDTTALLLFHSAGLTALAAAQEPNQTLADVWSQKRTAVADSVPLSPTALQRIDQLFPGELPLDPTISAGQIKSDLDLLSQVVSALLAAVDGPIRQVSALRWLRFFRSAALTVGACALVVAAVVGFNKLTAPVNLLAGVGFATSSAAALDPSAYGLLFHTNQENNPWVKYDLGSVKTLSSLEVHNRGEGLGERAIPLVAEVSIDNKSWKEVARQTQDFELWKPKLAQPVNARYLRLTTQRFSILHLSSVKAF